MVAAGEPGRPLVHSHQRWIVPASYLLKVEPSLALLLQAVISFEALQDGIDVFLHHLELVRHRDAVAVVIDRDDGGRLQHADRVNAFPEYPLSGRGIADACKRDLIPVARELLGTAQRLG